MIQNVIIIGSGPAGYTAAIYSSRAGLSPLLFTGIKVGGQLMDTGDVENFPGYKNSVTGPQMMEDLREQSIRFGTSIIYKMIKSVNLNVYPFIIYDEDNIEYQTKSLIISTGAEAKWLGIESERKFSGYGVSACATCDGFFFRGKNVIVVGGGDTACEEALYLTNICNSVTMLVRSDTMKASKIMADRVLKSKVNIKYNTSIIDIVGDECVKSVLTNNGEIFCDGVFIAIGHQPNTSLFKEQLKIDSEGYIVTIPGSTKTSVNGVFACGDVQDKIFRQAITAAGTGCMAALESEKFINS